MSLQLATPSRPVVPVRSGRSCPRHRLTESMKATDVTDVVRQVGLASASPTGDATVPAWLHAPGMPR
eukprot:11634965-Alexandrium_andersonii.AAC.1